jgi:hypothetical protein
MKLSRKLYRQVEFKIRQAMIADSVRQEPVNVSERYPQSDKPEGGASSK